MIYTVTLNPALDCEMRVDKLEYGDINRASSEKLYCGGKGINVALMLKTLGVESTALGFIAGFTGEKLAGMLSSERVACDFVRLREGMTRINVKIKSDRELDINAPGPRACGDEIEALIEKTARIEKGDILVLSGSIPPGMPGDLYERILKRVGARGVLTAVDTSGEALLGALKYGPFLVKPNHYELGDLFGTRITTERKVVFYAEKLRSAGARNVLVSRGGEGAVLVDETGRTHSLRAPEGRVVSTTGCGDSMIAGFITGWLRSADYAEALRLGGACASATAFSEGLADLDSVMRIYEKI